MFWIRRGLVETQSPKEAQEQAKNGGPKSGALALFTKYPKQAFTVIILTAGGTLAFNTFTTYLQKYLVNTSGFEKTTAPPKLPQQRSLSSFCYNRLLVHCQIKLAVSQL